MGTGPPPPSTSTRADPGRRYVVQLGTFPDPADAITARTALTVALSKRTGHARVVVAQAFPTPEAAAALCARIHVRGQACSVTEAWFVPGSDPPGRRVAEARGGR